MRNAVFAGALLSTIIATASADDNSIDEAQLEADAVVVGEIVLDKNDVFDLTDERENNFLFRLANKLHIITKDRVIQKQLLLKPGDLYSKRLVDESERILRRNSYLYDVTIAPINKGDDTVDLRVLTRDVWTLKPGLSLSRKGGENKTAFGIDETNLFGRGQTVRLNRTDDVDRESDSIEFSDAHLGNSWISASLLVANNSDGHSRYLSLIRPFYSLDTRWTAGITAFDDDQRSTIYDLGDPAGEYRQEQEQFSAFGGWTAGLRNGWVRRYTAGVVIDDNRFNDVVGGTLLPVIPDDRELVYPFLGFELLQDQFETAHNREQIAKTEDFFTGTRFSATLGFANESFGADRNAILYTASYARGFGAIDKKSLLFSAQASGRNERGNSQNALLEINARYFRQQSKKRVFFATIQGAEGHDLDLDNLIELGGDTGLRGYPLRYQTGDAKFLVTLEQRYFWDWYPFRLFRVGGAIFADVGRTWGDNPVGGESLGWLRDVGFGFRFASTRTGSRKMVHLDIAFPLDGDASIDEIQILLESKQSF